MSAAPNEGQIYEEGVVRDLIKSARDKYKEVHPREIRAVIDRDTAYLGRMDIEQLKGPAKEARLEIPPRADAEKVRRLIRDVIVEASGVRA